MRIRIYKPVSKTGQEKVGPQPLIVKSSTSQLASVASQRSNEFRNDVSKDKSKHSLQEPSIDPEQLMLKSAREAEQRLTKSNKFNISRDDSLVNLVEQKAKHRGSYRNTSRIRFIFRPWYTNFQACISGEDIG